MSLEEVVEVTGMTQEYLVYLKGIEDGAEADYTEEDAEQAEQLSALLEVLDLDQE